MFFAITKFFYHKWLQLFLFLHEQKFRKNSDMQHSEALMYAGGIVALSAISGLVINQFFVVGFHNGMKVRVAVCSIIYRKVRPAFIVFTWSAMRVDKLSFIRFLLIVYNFLSICRHCVCHKRHWEKLPREKWSTYYRTTLTVLILYQCSCTPCGQHR